jgi:hypothetical protein
MIRHRPKEGWEGRVGNIETHSVRKIKYNMVDPDEARLAGINVAALDGLG